MNNSNPAREVQTYVCNYLNEQLSALSVDFLAEDRKDIEFLIKNNLQKIGIATTVMTPTMNYLGKTEHGQAWEVPDFTIQTVEYVPVNRASNKQNWSSGFDICFAVQQVMAGPDAPCGFGKFNPVRLEQGEDNGLVVNKAIFKCYFVDDLTPPEPPRPREFPYGIASITDTTHELGEYYPVPYSNYFDTTEAWYYKITAEWEGDKLKFTWTDSRTGKSPITFYEGDPRWQINDELIL